VVEYGDDGAGPAAAPVPSDAQRLQAALEALTARDQVLADRTRRLAALESTSGRLAALAARLEAAEEEVATLRRARAAEAAEREERIAELERRLAGGWPAPQPAVVEDPGGSGVAGTPTATLEPSATAGLVARLGRDLELERQRNFRLAGRGSEGAAVEALTLQEALDDCHRRRAALERQLAEFQSDGAAGPGGAYARWEAWFRRRVAERHEADLQRAEETARSQHSVLEEKERLIATLLDRLRAAGEVQEGPDDLKRVIGIGPVIEDLLHGLGITTFEQLASLSEEEVDRIGDLLGAFRERIRRDGWAQQAAELARRRVRLGPGLSLR
jgi:predicted flap endonuclease-1-like 5' DNA nuclease